MRIVGSKSHRYVKIFHHESKRRRVVTETPLDLEVCTLHWPLVLARATAGRAYPSFAGMERTCWKIGKGKSMNRNVCAASRIAEHVQRERWKCMPFSRSPVPRISPFLAGLGPLRKRQCTADMSPIIHLELLEKGSSASLQRCLTSAFAPCMLISGGGSVVQ